MVFVAFCARSLPAGRPLLDVRGIRKMKLNLVQLFVLGVVLVAVLPLRGNAQGDTPKLTSLTATAKGQGTITVSDPGVAERKRPLNSIVVTLRENGDAEIVVITDMQLFARGRWTKPADLSQGINLKITGGTVANNAKGSGKLFLRPDGKSIDKLNFEARSNA